MKTFSILKAAGLLTLSVLALMPNTSSAKGGLDAGGGYAIQCDDGKLYSWDYVNQPFSAMPVNPQLLKAKTAKEVVNLIAARLIKINVQMGESLADFAKFNEDYLAEVEPNAFETSETRVWLKNANPLLQLNDEDRMRIPKSCVKAAKANFKVKQAVVRKPIGGYNKESGNDSETRLLYYADSNVLSALEKNSPIQLSSLYIHEWLRDYVQDPSKIAMANQLLHAAKWPETEGRFVEIMKQFDLDVRTSGHLAGHYVFTGVENMMEPENASGDVDDYKRSSSSTVTDFTLVRKGKRDYIVQGALKPLQMSVVKQELSEGYVKDVRDDNGKPVLTHTFMIRGFVFKGDSSEYVDGVTLGQQPVAIYELANGVPTGRVEKQMMKISLSMESFNTSDSKDKTKCYTVVVNAESVAQVPNTLAYENERRDHPTMPAFKAQSATGYYCRARIGINAGIVK